MKAAVLDIGRLAKVKALHDRATIPCEKAAAARGMAAIAQAAGMTVETALSKLDTAKKRKVMDTSPLETFERMWNDLMNTPEQRAFEARRQAELKAKRQEALAEHGTAEAVFAESRWERRLRLACEPLIERHPVHGYVSKLDGWGTHDPYSKMPASVRAAVSTAYRLPRTVAEAWGEVQHWEQVLDQRCAFDRDYTPDRWTDARRCIIEGLCDTLPGIEIEDLQARVAWLRYVNNLGYSRDVHEDNVLIDRLAVDVAGMAGVVTTLAAIVERPKAQASAVEVSPRSGENLSAAVQTGRQPRTRAEKRAAVLTLLTIGKSDTGLSDREIARRVGVSPSTVGAIRKAVSSR